MTEIISKVDVANGKIKEVREAVRGSKDTKGMFYLSATEGNFNFYNNPGAIRDCYFTFHSSIGYLQWLYRKCIYPMFTYTLNFRGLELIGNKAIITYWRNEWNR